MKLPGIPRLGPVELQALVPAQDRFIFGSIITVFI